MQLKIKAFINKYNWEGINDWKKFEKSNATIALNVMYTKKEKIYPAYVSKHILLMISNREKLRHDFAVKKLSALFRGITSKYHGDFYCMN